MSRITKEQMDQFLRDNEAELEDVITIIEEDYGISFLENGLNQMSEKQVERMTKAISENDEIIEKVKKARQKRDPEFSSYLRSKKNFNKFLDEARRGR